MKYKILSLLLISVCIASLTAGAKTFDKEYIKRNLLATSYPIDEDASAVVLYESNFTIMISENGLFKCTQYVHKVIKILKDDAQDLGNVHIIFMHDDDKNYLENVRAITYNLSGNEIDSSVVTDNDLLKKGIVKKAVVETSFSLPSVKAGSIIDFSYEIVSDRASKFMTWQIQEKYPKLICEYGMLFPAHYQFTSLSHARGELKNCKNLNEAETCAEEFCVSKNNKGGDNTVIWVRKNVAGIKKEPYVINDLNYIESLELELTGSVSFVSSHYIYSSISILTKTWEDYNNVLWNKLGLKSVIHGENIFLNPIVDSLVKPSMTQEEKAKSIFRYVRNNFKLDQTERELAKPDLKAMLSRKKGSVSDINIMLSALLKKANLDASLSILSTTSVISPSPLFPAVDRVNYMASVVTIDSVDILLDATDKNNVFGVLPSNCYNGFVWILEDKGRGIYVTPEMLKDRNIVSIKINEFTDSSANIEIMRRFGAVSAMGIRRAIEKDRDTKQQMIDRIRRHLPDDMTLLNGDLENESQPDTTLILHYRCKMKFDKRTNNFFMPADMAKVYDENPFKGTSRTLPIEFPYKSENVYYMSMTLPKNMVPDSTSPPITLDYEEGALHYKKAITYVPELSTYTVSSSFQINKTRFTADYYESMRDFFQKVIDDSNQMIVLKKTHK